MAMQVGESGDGEETPMSDINTTPLVDVMLVLLIIFLITVPVVLQTVPLTLPKVEFQPNQNKPEDVNLSVRAENGQCEVYWDLQRMTAETLLDRGASTLETYIRSVGGAQNITEDNMPEVHIRGDINTPYRCIGAAIFTMQRAGYPRIGFISEPDPHGGIRF
jgi:biopolymer transport protein ExbD